MAHERVLLLGANGPSGSTSTSINPQSTVERRTWVNIYRCNIHMHSATKNLLLMATQEGKERGICVQERKKLSQGVSSGLAFL